MSHLGRSLSKPWVTFDDVKFGAEKAHADRKNVERPRVPSRIFENARHDVLIAKGTT